MYAGDQKVGKAVELSADNKWTHTFSNLDEKKAGQVINYTVKEIDVPEGYTQAVEATNPGQVVVTNTHEPEKTKVEVSKKWEDGDDQDGLRPASIQVQLYKDGLPTDQVLELSAANDWKGAFENLDAKAAGKAIAYTVKEVTVPDGYKVTVNDKDKANVVLTNTHEPALTEMKVTKKWDDANDQDGLRPKSIKVQLYANDEKVGDPVELSADNKWTHTFSKLPEKKAGQAISYRVEEVDLPKGYEARNDEDGKGNAVITNKHVPKETPKQPTPPSSSEPKKPGQPEPKKPSQPEPKKPGKILGFLPNTGTTISIISLVLAFVLASIAAYILKKKKK